MLHSIWFQLYHTLEKAKLEWHKRLIFARAQGEGGINKEVKDSAQVKNVLIKKKKKTTHSDEGQSDTKVNLKSSQKPELEKLSQ